MEGLDIMKLAFSATGTDLDAEIDPRFGRCAYFIVVNPDDMSFEAFENESMSLGGEQGSSQANSSPRKGPVWS